MTRRITEFNQLASSPFAMQDQVQDMLEKTLLAKAILGPKTDGATYPGTFTPLADGFNCRPTSPASLSVVVDPGTMFDWQFVDATDFGYAPTQISADTTNYTLKYGFTKVADAQNTKPIVPPVTPGDSRNDLIQIQLAEGDGATVTGINGTPTIGSTEPVSFWQGVTGTTPNPPLTTNKFTLRIDSVVISVKAGVAAPTGTQVTPAPDAGFHGLWVVTTANGQTSITSGDIAQYPTSIAIPLDEKLPDKISLTTAEAHFPTFANIQASAPIYSNDTGTANTYVATLTPALGGYTAGDIIYLKIAHANTGASTLNVNGLGAKAITLSDTSPLIGGELALNMIAQLFYDGTRVQLLNPSQHALVASVSLAGSQTISTGNTANLIHFDTVDFDPNSMWDAGNFRFVPKKSGYWRFSAAVLCRDVEFQQDCFIDLYKNGGVSKRISEVLSAGSVGDNVITGSAIVQANGSTDYFELNAFNSSSTTTYTIGFAVTQTYFQIEYIGS